MESRNEADTPDTTLPVSINEDYSSDPTMEMNNYAELILDFFNRSIKTEEENQQENSFVDAENEEESVEDLLERAENLFREGLQHLSSLSVVESIIEPSRLPTLDTTGSHIRSYTTGSPICSFTTGATGSAIRSYTTVNTSSIHESTPVTNAPRIPMPNIILSDTDSDDEVIFVDSVPSVIPVIDLSAQCDDKIQETPSVTAVRKRTSNLQENNSSQEKHFRLTCGVCLEEVNQPHSTVCGHIYCGDCIKKSVRIFKKCPTCKKNLKLSNIHPIYI